MSFREKLAKGVNGVVQKALGPWAKIYDVMGEKERNYVHWIRIMDVLEGRDEKSLEKESLAAVMNPSDRETSARLVKRMLDMEGGEQQLIEMIKTTRKMLAYQGIEIGFNDPLSVFGEKQKTEFLSSQSRRVR